MHVLLLLCVLIFRQVLHGTAGAMSPQVQARNQQLPGSTPVSNFLMLTIFLFSMSRCWSISECVCAGNKDRDESSIKSEICRS